MRVEVIVGNEMILWPEKPTPKSNSFLHHESGREDHPGIEVYFNGDPRELVSKIRTELINTQRIIDPRYREKLLRGFFRVPIKSQLLKQGNERLELVYCEPLIPQSPSQQGRLDAIVDLNKLSDHRLQSENHGMGYHIHMAAKKDNRWKRYDVIFTCLTTKQEQTKVHTVSWEQHGKSHAFLNIRDVNKYSLKKRKELHTISVQLLSDIDDNQRKLAGADAKILRTD